MTEKNSDDAVSQKTDSTHGMTDDDYTETTFENDGRSVEIDTGFYRVQVWGDTDDSFDAVLEKAMTAADRAKEDAAELDERIDTDGRHYR